VDEQLLFLFFFLFFSGGRYTTAGDKTESEGENNKRHEDAAAATACRQLGPGGYVFCNNTSSTAVQTIQVRYRNRTNKAKRVGGNEGGQKIKIDYPVSVCVCVKPAAIKDYTRLSVETKVNFFVVML
jgi:hypothetical protein